MLRVRTCRPWLLTLSTATLLTMLAVTPPASAATITVEYEAYAATVIGTPLGMTIPRETTVTGSFFYDTDTPESDDTIQSGQYPHAPGTGGFTANVLGTTVTGSDTPWYEALPPTAFRINDGPRNIESLPQGGIMSVNGVEDESLELWLSIVSSDDIVPTGGLPAPFPPFYFGFLPDAHTFRLRDSGGTMLMQVTSMQQVPEPSTIGMLIVGSLIGLVGLRRRNGR